MVIYHEKIALEVSGAKLTNVTINHGFYIGWFNSSTSALNKVVKKVILMYIMRKLHQRSKAN